MPNVQGQYKWFVGGLFFPKIPRDGSDKSEECMDLKQSKHRSINMSLPRGRTVLEKGCSF